MEKLKNARLENLKENSLSKEEKDKQERDILESFNNLHLKYYAYIHISVHYKGYLWQAERNFLNGMCLERDEPLHIRKEDIFRFIGRDDVVAHLSYFTDIKHEESYTIIKSPPVLSDIGLTLDVNGNHDECARNKIIAEKVKALRDEIEYSKDDISFDEYSFEIIRKNLLANQQQKPSAFDKHTGQNNIAEPAGKVAYPEMADDMPSGILPKNSGRPKTAKHNALKTWQKYMLCAAAIIATTDKKRYLHKQPKQQDKIFNYAQLELVFKEMAGRLLGTDSSISTVGYGLSDENIATILENALEKYPIDIDELWRY
jgi:hypothetical protein